MSTGSVLRLQNRLSSAHAWKILLSPILRNEVSSSKNCAIFHRCYAIFSRQIDSHFLSSCNSIALLQNHSFHASGHLKNPSQLQISFYQHFSTRTDKKSPYNDNDKCALFDQGGTLLRETTFAEAKSHASMRKARLVFMHKNPDGTLCFSIQPVAEQEVADKSDSQDTFGDKQQKAKERKPAVKEYKLKAVIAKHDLQIKINQIQSHLTKGKQVVIILKKASKSKSNSQNNIPSIMSQLTEALQDVCKIRQDQNSDSITKLTLIPKQVQNHEDEK